jgi:hypothetical protein
MGPLTVSDPAPVSVVLVAVVRLPWMIEPALIRVNVPNVSEMFVPESSRPTVGLSTPNPSRVTVWGRLIPGTRNGEKWI